MINNIDLDGNQVVDFNEFLQMMGHNSVNKIPTYKYTPGGFVWCDRSFYIVKLSQEKWVCDFHDDAPPLSFQLQVAEVIF